MVLRQRPGQKYNTWKRSIEFFRLISSPVWLPGLKGPAGGGGRGSFPRLWIFCKFVSTSFASFKAAALPAYPPLQNRALKEKVAVALAIRGSKFQNCTGSAFRPRKNFCRRLFWLSVGFVSARPTGQTRKVCQTITNCNFGFGKFKCS